MKAELAQRWKKGAHRGRHCGTALGCLRCAQWCRGRGDLAVRRSIERVVFEVRTESQRLPADGRQVR